MNKNSTNEAQFEPNIRSKDKLDVPRSEVEHALNSAKKATDSQGILIEVLEELSDECIG